MHRKLVVTIAGISLFAFGIIAGTSHDPFAERADNPYAVSVKTEPRDNGSVTVNVSVVEKATGQIVLSPTVTTRAGQPAEIFSDGTNGRSFESRIVVDDAGKVTVTFKAYERVLQRSIIRS